MNPKHFILSLLALFVSTTASADTWTDANGIVWSFTTSGSNATINSISGSIPNNLIIPSKVYNGENEYLVTAIGNQAFYNKSNLMSINIPDGVTSIGNQAFFACQNLNSINIPSGVTYMGSDVFKCYNIIIGNHGSLVDVHYQSLTPRPSYSWDNNVTLFVPDEALEVYKNQWPNYVNQILPESKFTYNYNISVTAKEGSSDVIETIGESDAINVVNLKVSGTINSYDLMVFRNKMINLRHLDLSDAQVVSCSYKYYDKYYTKDNVITGYFAPPSITSIALPQNIITIEEKAFAECKLLNTIELPENIVSIPSRTFYNNWHLKNVIIPQSVTSIGTYAFYYCFNMSQFHLPKQLLSIGNYCFGNCSELTEIYLPPHLTTIGNNAFSGCSKLTDIYAYMPDIISIGTETFNNYKSQQLYVPQFLYNNYYYDTNWSQFLNINRTNLSSDDYETVPTNSDITMGENDQRIPDMSNGEHVDGEINTQGSFTVEGSEPQNFDEVDQILDGEGQGGSLIGEDDGTTAGNLQVNTLRVKINVKAGRWYFFCFPFDVTIANCEYPGQYAWRYYDGAYRASNGSGGWKPVAGETLNALEGYAFQSSHAGNLIISFNHPTFGGNRPKTLVAHAAANAANASWNLVGNPYSCFYDFLDDAFASPITVYNNGTYTAYRPGDDDCHLQPYQAFFVQKPIDVDLINFVPGHRESYRQSLEAASQQQQRRRARGINPERLLINLEIMSDDNMIDRTRVVFNEKAQHAYELECDASKFISNDAVAQLYSIENGMQMAINERPLEGDIRLGYIAKHAGTLSISAPRMDMPMMLVDTKLGITFDLSVGAYEFETTAGTFNNRFYLRLSGDATAINNLKKETGVCIGIQIGGIAVGGAEGKTVSVYTTGGQMAAQHSGNGFIALKSGIYVVNVDGTTAKVSVK